MARELRITYEGLEEQVEARTQDLRRANEELAAQRDSLEALSEKLAKESQVKSDLLSMVNHELRTPLTSIITLAQIALESGGADAEERRSWEEVRKSSSVLLGMINDMLDIARSDAGAMAVSMELMDLGDIVASAQGTIGPLAVGARVTLTTTVAPDVPLVSGDYEKMLRILENLGSNAVKFTPAGGTVAIAVVREEDYGRCAGDRIRRRHRHRARRTRSASSSGSSRWTAPRRASTAAADWGSPSCASTPWPRDTRWR